jgi:facilitated trehalose transporter
VELSLIKENIQRTTSVKSEGEGFSLAPLMKRPVLAPLFISMSLMFFQQWCGVNAVIFYTVAIFHQAGSEIEKNLATVIVGIVQFLATLCELVISSCYTRPYCA